MLTLYTMHCPKNNLNLRIKSEHVTVGSDANICVLLLHT